MKRIFAGILSAVLTVGGFTASASHAQGEDGAAQALEQAVTEPDQAFDGVAQERGGESAVEGAVGAKEASPVLTPEAPRPPAVPEVPETPLVKPGDTMSCPSKDYFEDGKGGLMFLTPIGWVMAPFLGIAQLIDNARFNRCVGKAQKEMAVYKRTLLARQGDAYVVEMGYSKATVGQLRAAGFAVQIADDGRDCLIAADGSPVNETRAMYILIGIAKGRDALVRRMKEEGDDHIIPGSDDIGVIAATVKEIRQEGYEVEIDEMAEYRFVGKGETATYFRGTWDTVKRIHTARRIRPGLERFKRDPAAFEVVWCAYRSVGGELQYDACPLRATVGEIRGAGFNFTMNGEGVYSITDLMGGARNTEEVLRLVVGRRGS